MPVNHRRHDHFVRTISSSAPRKVHQAVGQAEELAVHVSAPTARRRHPVPNHGPGIAHTLMIVIAGRICIYTNVPRGLANRAVCGPSDSGQRQPTMTSANRNRAARWWSARWHRTPPAWRFNTCATDCAFVMSSSPHEPTGSKPEDTTRAQRGHNGLAQAQWQPTPANAISPGQQLSLAVSR